MSIASTIVASAMAVKVNFGKNQITKLKGLADYKRVSKQVMTYIKVL